jgi:hypothetical protein
MDDDDEDKRLLPEAFSIKLEQNLPENGCAPITTVSYNSEARVRVTERFDHIPRMTIGRDPAGLAIGSDGHHFLGSRFSILDLATTALC